MKQKNLWQHSEADDKDVSRTTSGKALNDQEKHPSRSPDNTWKIDEACSAMSKPLLQMKRE